MNRIVVIEDDPAILQGLETTLRSESYDVFTAEDGEDGCRLVQPPRISRQAAFRDSMPEPMTMSRSHSRFGNCWDACEPIFVVPKAGRTLQTNPNSRKRKRSSSGFAVIVCAD